MTACSSRFIHGSARELLETDALKSAHVGLSIYDPSSHSFIYDYQGDKYFVPASNTKIPTCYAAMKYLDDSLVGLRYELFTDGSDSDYKRLLVEPTGDPTFLHPDFKSHPVFEFLKNAPYEIGMTMPYLTRLAYARGWNISDLTESYMPPRSNFPIYGNVARFYMHNGDARVEPESLFDMGNVHGLFPVGDKPAIERYPFQNFFLVRIDSSVKNFRETIPFFPDYKSFEKMLVDTLGKKITSFKYRWSRWKEVPFITLDPYIHNTFNIRDFTLTNASKIYSHPTDSLLKPMMHRSDNFFAEQSLLMVSNELLGEMDDAAIIDTILKTDFRDLPQQPRWVDGSGLSRYNLFSPRDFVRILEKMQTEFGMDRIKEIFPTGGEGTISSYYKTDSGFIYAKTGTLSGVVAFSGFLYTKKGKLLIFSTLVNNHQTSATTIRRAVEKFLQQIRERY